MAGKKKSIEELIEKLKKHGWLEIQIS